MVADLFVFGDVRDLVIQGGRALRGEETDEVIVGLSAAGLLLTAAPQLDLGTALLKFARRMGALSAPLRQRAGDAGPARGERAQRGAADAASPTTPRPEPQRAAGRGAGDPAQCRRRRRPAARRRLRATARRRLRPVARAGATACRWLKSTGSGGEALLLRAARKGTAGLAFVGRKGALLLQPHPLLGLVKGLYKGTLPQFVMRMLEPRSRQLLLAGALGWLLLEIFVLAWRLVPRRGRATVRAR